MIMKSANLSTTIKHSSALNRVLDQPWYCDDSLRVCRHLLSVFLTVQSTLLVRTGVR